MVVMKLPLLEPLSRVWRGQRLAGAGAAAISSGANLKPLKIAEIETLLVPR